VIDPEIELQISVVQPLPSLMAGNGVCVIVPVAELHASVVQTLLSFILTGVCVTDPVAELQKSVVQRSPSLNPGQLQPGIIV
jgi:hypothetical protein